jgi:DNA topoisomerase-3
MRVSNDILSNQSSHGLCCWEDDWKQTGCLLVSYWTLLCSYPRTESTAYSASFDVQGALSLHRKHPIWGDYVASLMAAGPHTPKSGVDAGDHPPITPMLSATEAELGGGDAWRLFEYVTRHFLGSVSPDCKYTRWSSKTIFHFQFLRC